MTNKPIWIADNPLIERLLNIFIDQCNRKDTVRFQKSINKKSTPELFDFDNGDPGFLWQVLESKLLIESKVIERIKYRRVSLTSQHYENAIIYFNRSTEDLVRVWLNRAAIQSYKEEWQKAIIDYPCFQTSSLNQEIQVRPHTAKQLLAGFSRVKLELSELVQKNETISLRGLSARCFWGDSKFLDNRRALLDDVFSESARVILPRAIMLSAYIPKNLKTVVFIENFDSFLSTVKAINNSRHNKHTAIVYSAGYRGSAQLIRSLGQCQFVTINSVEQQFFKQFHNWWFKLNDLQIRTYFWGDFDFEGMRILKALRHNFPETQAWKLAYDLTLDYHAKGLGHSPEVAGKESQKIPELSGCIYTDQIIRYVKSPIKQIFSAKFYACFKTRKLHF